MYNGDGRTRLYRPGKNSWGRRGERPGARIIKMIFNSRNHLIINLFVCTACANIPLFVLSLSLLDLRFCYTPNSQMKGRVNLKQTYEGAIVDCLITRCQRKQMTGYGVQPPHPTPIPAPPPAPQHCGDTSAFAGPNGIYLIAYWRL